LLDNDIVDFYESQLETYDELNSHFEIYYREFGNWIKKHLDKKRSNVADMGCGTGTLSKILTELGHTVYGIDVSGKLIKVAATKSKENFLFLRGDISNLPIRESSIDNAICFGVLDQVDEIEKVIDEAWRILKPGGRFLFDISPFPTLDFWYFLGLYGKSGFSSAVRGIYESKIQFSWSIRGDDGKSKLINIYRYKPSHIERMIQKKGFKTIGRRGFHISKMFIPEKIHVDGRSKVLLKIDNACWRLDDYLNRFNVLQENALYLMYACMKMRTNAKYESVNQLLF